MDILFIFLVMSNKGCFLIIILSYAKSDFFEDPF